MKKKKRRWTCLRSIIDLDRRHFLRLLPRRIKREKMILRILRNKKRRKRLSSKKNWG
jgi:hypothetical protein